MAEKKKKKNDAMNEAEQQAAETAAAEAADTAAEEAAQAETDAAVDNDAVQALEAELAATKEAAAEAAAKLLRMQADFDNFRRRQREENERTVAQAAAGVVKELLPVLDNFERALAAMGDSPDKAGVEMIAKQLLTVLVNAGLEEVAAMGADFDPNVHQAVMQADKGEENKNKVTAVLQRGYLLKGKLLRAAMVEVGM